MTPLPPARLMRTWTGWIAIADRGAYSDYVSRTGIDAYRSTAGNLGAWLAFRDLDDDRTEVITVSLWIDRTAVIAFAGDDIERAVFYPEDDRYLIDRETSVRHYDLPA